ncbi:helix-turn-helix domain-containing protein [Aquimarina longa]|uniref:helix-turn-helix domain-containing protein n=1 Tax=Aquimarina longa TaxID=1080221 RepID=UPI000782BE23|nr:helix-turn-helix domain-containing protein [Aquimarina longa]
MSDLRIIDLVLFLGISQGFFLAIIIQLLPKKNLSANLVLSLILFLSAIMLTGRLYYYGYEENEFFARLVMLVDSIIFLFGPLLYLYVRRMIVSSDVKPVLRWVEFLPSALHLMYVLWTYRFSIIQLQEMYDNGFFTIPFFIIELSIIILFTIYIIKCFIILKKFRLAEERILSFHQQIYVYLMILISIFALVTVFWFLNFAKSYLLHTYNPYFNYNTVWLCIPIIMYVVGFYSIRQPEIFRVAILTPKKKIFKSRLSKAKIEQLTADLEHLLVHDKIYLNPNLTLARLATQLKTSTNDVSWLLNKIHKCNFYEYINTYRVQEFISKINKGEHKRHTILALSLDSGFNSKSTFNKAFKIILRDTPSNYIKKMIKD